MSVLFEEWQPNAVDEAKRKGPYHPRITLHVRTGDTIWRFIKDVQDYTINGWEFLKLPFMELSAIETSEGDIADRVDITLYGRDLVYEDGVEMVTAFSAVQEQNLRGAPTQIGLVMLDDSTMKPVGLQADFVGFFEGVELDLENGGILSGSILSQETWFHQRVPEVYMDTSHRQLFSNDGAFKHVSDVVNRGGNAIWNGRESGTQGSRRGGGGGGGGGGRGGGGGVHLQQY